MWLPTRTPSFARKADPRRIRPELVKSPRSIIGALALPALRLEAILERSPEVRKPEVYERDPRASSLDIRRARERLGWAPEADRGTA